MTVGELIRELELLPENYQVVFESGDGYGSAYYVYVNEAIANGKTKEVELYGV